MQKLKSKTKLVHVSLMDDGHALCARDGKTPLTETSYPINCEVCRKALEILNRKQMTSLSAEGMLKVLDLITAMRNGDLYE